MMNTVRKSENLLPFPVISAAANGDTNAMCAILKHYEGYIAKLCTRTLKDDAGNLKDFPLFCPKCKLTHIIDVEKLEIVIKNTEKQTFII